MCFNTEAQLRSRIQVYFDIKARFSLDEGTIFFTFIVFVIIDNVFAYTICSGQITTKQQNIKLELASLYQEQWRSEKYKKRGGGHNFHIFSHFFFFGRTNLKLI